MNLIAKASITINAPVSKVWEALTNPEIIKKYMFGADVISDWEEGSEIIWRGEWQGKNYVDKGKILRIEKNEILEYSHYSPLSGKEDVPENYHIVTIELFYEDGKTIVELSQDNNENEKERVHSQKNWETMLGSLKKVVE